MLALRVMYDLPDVNENTEIVVSNKKFNGDPTTRKGRMARFEDLFGANDTEAIATKSMGE